MAKSDAKDNVNNNESHKQSTNKKNTIPNNKNATSQPESSRKENKITTTTQAHSNKHKSTQTKSNRQQIPSKRKANK